MNIFRVVWRLIRAIPLIYFFNTLCWVALSLLDLVPGLVTKAFFDRITQGAPVGLSIGWIMGLTIAFAVGGMLSLYGGIVLDTRTRFFHNMLLQRNLRGQILRRPGAMPIRGSTGQAISTFRDDARVLEDTADWVIDSIAQILFGVVAITILLSINWQLALLTLLPLFLILGVAQAAGNRL